MGGPVLAAAPLVLGGLGAGLSFVQGQQQAKQAKKANAQAVANAAETKAQADQAFNAANKKKPNVQGLESANQLAATGGVGSTLLTGAGGVDPQSLTLGRTTLLGG